MPTYSNKYNTKYNHSENGNTQTLNYNENSNENIKRLGEAIWETSASGTGATSWNEESSNFLNTIAPFSVRGGAWSDMSSAGLFSYSQNNGYCNNNVGFRAVLIAE